MHFGKGFMNKGRLIFNQFPLFFFVLTFLALIVFRWRLNLEKITRMTACASDCLVWDVPAYDLGILGGMLALIGLAKLLPWVLRWLLGMVIALLVVFYVLDVFIYDLFNFRLQIVDVLKYAGDISSNKTVAWPRVASVFGVFLFSLGLLAIFFAFLAIFRGFSRNEVPKLLACFLAFPCLLGLRYLPQEKDYVLQDQNQDFLSSNLPAGVDREFSAEFAARMRALPEPSSICTKFEANEKSVILLVVESLSAYQSKKMSGLKDWLPGLDAIADKYAYLGEFYANGFTTDGGLVALLTGYVPFPQVNRYRSVQVFSGYEESRQDFFKKLANNGVFSTYFTSADLNFLGAKSWLSGLGFDYMEGPEHAYYADLPRGVFNDPGDKALYSRYLNWLDHERGGRRIFSVLQTVTTHPPFVVPGAKSGEEAAFRYADEALVEFVQELEARDFFSSGVLVITGDHRSMTLLTAKEKALLGAAAPARIPAVIVGNDFKGRGRMQGQWQQTDVIASVLAALGLESCTSDFQGRFLGESVEPEFILHALGVERDKVLVKVKNQGEPSFVVLDGDDTRWDSPPEAVRDDQVVLQEINRQRARLPVVESNFAHELLKIYRLVP